MGVAVPPGRGHHTLLVAGLSFEISTQSPSGSSVFELRIASPGSNKGKRPASNAGILKCSNSVSGDADG